MLDANAATISLPVALVKISSNASTTSSSEPVKPRRSMFVLSANSASTPAPPSSAKRCTSKCWPSIGVWSILKSPVWTTTPAGVWMASATQSGMLCVTRMNSISNGPTVTRSRGRTGTSRAPVDAVLLELRLDQRQRQRRAVDRAVDERQHVRHAADVILVAVRQHERGDAPFLLQVGQIRNDAVDAEQLGVREHHARVDDDRRLAPGEREHVHAELAEPAERHDFEHRETAGTHQRPGHSWRSQIRSMGAAAAARSGCWVRLK